MTNALFSLPGSWSWATVQDMILDAQSGFASGKKNVPQGIKHLRMNSIGKDCSLNLSSVVTVPFNLARQAHILQFGDVLFCHTNSLKLVGKTAMFDRTDGPYAFSNHLTRLRLPQDGPPPEWLWYWLATLWRQRYFETRCKQWVNQATVERQTLLSSPIPVAPLKEQHRIMSLVKPLMAQNRMAKHRLQKVPSVMKAFRRSVLAKAFRGELTQRDPNDEPAEKLLERIRHERRKAWKEELRAKGKDPRKYKYHDPIGVVSEKIAALPRGWIWTNFDTLLSGARYGTSQKCRTKAIGIPVLRIPNIVEGVLDLKYLKYSEFKADEIQRLRVQQGDLLVCRSNGSLGLVGKSAVVNDLKGTCVFASYLIRLRPAISEILPEYLNFVLASPIGRTKIEEKARTTAGQYNVNLEMLRSIPVPLPPFEEMGRIITRVREQLGYVAQVESNTEGSLKNVDLIEVTVLNKAFRGELVPQDLSDEPVSLLLERIESQRAKMVKTRRLQRRMRIAGPAETTSED